MNTMPTNESVVNFKKILINTANSKKYAEEIIRAEKLSGSAKNTIKHMIQKLEVIERDMYLRVPPEFTKIIKDEITDNWETLAFQNIFDMMCFMDDEQRRRIEDFTESVYNETKK